MMFSERIRRVLDVQPGEGKTVGLMTAYFMLLIFAFLVGRTVRDALFLANYGIESLPWMYVGTAVVVSVTSQLYSRFSSRFNPRLMGYGVALLFAGSFVLFRFVVVDSPSFASYAALYLWIEVFGGVALLEYWSTAGEVFEQRQAKRLYGLVSAGQVFSNLLCGALSSTLSTAWGAENLLWLAVGALVAVLPLLVAVNACRINRRTPRKAPPPIDKKDPSYRKHLGYLRTIAAVVALTFLSTSIIDFQFKLAAKSAFPGKDELAAYFGIFYAAVGTIGFFLQTFFTGRITKALGVLETLGIMPGFFLVGSVAQLLVPGLLFATGTKLFEAVLRYSVNDPVTQLLYLPLPTNLRMRALALAAGTIKPWAMGGAGLIMLALSPFFKGTPWMFSYLVVILCAGWMALLIRLKRGYLGAVASGAEEARRLVWQRPHLDPTDPLVVETILRTLKEADPDKIDYALSLASKVEIDGLEEHLRICLTRSGVGKALVLRALELRRDDKFVVDIRRCIDPSEPPVTRAAAVRALASIEGERALSIVRKALSDSSPVVRAGALEALVLYCGPKGLSMALGGLDAMLAAGDPAARVLAIRVVAHTAVPHPFQLLEPLIDDPDAEVAREAIRTLGARCDEAAMWPLLDVLGEPRTASVAAEGLAKFGKPVVEPLAQHLADAGRPIEVREAALKGLAANRAPEAGDALAASLHGLPWELRLHAAQALQRKLRQGDWSPAERTKGAVEKACVRQINEAAWYRVVAGSGDHGEVVGVALRERVLAGELQALRLATLLHPDEELVVLARSGVLGDPYKRQLLMEICDNTLGGAVKDGLLALLEDNDARKLSSLAVRHGEIPPAGMVLRILAFSVEPWLPAVSVWQAHKAGNTDVISEISGVQTMLDLVDKVLLLKSATLFEHLTGADIEKIANIAQECIFEPREAVFEQGDPGDALYIVTHGQVKVHIGEKQLAVLKERDCFGEMAILDDQPRSASVTSLGEVKCLKIRRDDFFFLLEDHFEIVKSIIRVLTERLRNTNMAQAAPPPAAPPAAAS